MKADGCDFSTQWQTPLNVAVDEQSLAAAQQNSDSTIHTVTETEAHQCQ